LEALPVFHAGAVADIITARYAVAEGHVDLIGMTRRKLPTMPLAFVPMCCLKRVVR